MACLPTDTTLAGQSTSAFPLFDRRVPRSSDDCCRKVLASMAWPCAAATLSGLMMSGCFWPVNAHWLAWIAMVPWLIALPRVAARDAWLCGTVLGFVFYGVGLAWLFRIHGPLAGVVVAVLAIWMGLAFRVTRLLVDRFSPAAIVWALPLMLVGQDVLRCEGLPQLRFPFLALGYSQSQNHWVAQIASIGGVHGISLLIVLVNAAIARGITRRHWRGCLPAIASIAAVLLLATLSQPSDHAGLPRIPVACIQVANHSADLCRDLTRRAVDDCSRPRLVVLPEHTIADDATEGHPLVQALANTARTYGAVICVGAHTRAPDDTVCGFNNIAMLIGSDGRILAEQPKAVPLPFFRDGLPARHQSVTPTQYGTIGTYVCYDGLFTDIPRRAVGAGAEILLVPSMDAESWPEQERWQHAEMAPLRSIELRRCAVRANGSGVSQIVDAAGRVTACRTNGEGPGILLGDVYRLSERTAFVRGGYLFAPAAGISFLVAIAWLTLAEWHGRITGRIGVRAERRMAAPLPDLIAET